MNLPKTTYTYSTKQYALDQIISYYKQNKIDTDLDCQRGLVWTDSQKQDFIDTLVRRERIPEFHVIKEDYESIFHFADGKQRITTSIDFLTNKLKWLKSKAGIDFQDIFGNKTFLYFKDLPEEWRNAILNNELQFACYKDMDARSTTILFRKLNNGTSLSSFAKGLASHISVKRYFLDKIMRHPACKIIFTKSMLDKDDAEQLFVRLYILMKTFDINNKTIVNIDLTPPALEKYYLDVETADDEAVGKWIKELEKYTTIINGLLDRINTFDNSDNLLQTSKGFPLLFAMFFTYIRDYSDEDFEALYLYLNNKRASDIVGAGADYSASKVGLYIKEVYKWEKRKEKKNKNGFFI